MRTLILAAAAAAALTASANAGSITGYIFTDQPGAAANATLAQFAALGGAGGANATFTVGGTTNFSDAAPFGTGDSTTTTIDQFLMSGGTSVGGATGAHILNETYFYFTGTVGLHAGANTFTITHDDGLQFNIDGIGLAVDAPGPTAPVPATFTVNAPSAGNYTFELSYGETAGGPAQITVFGGTLVPEPGSMAILGLGFAAAAFGVRRRAK